MSRSSALYCLCVRENDMSTTAVDIIMLGSHAGILLQLPYIYDVILRSVYSKIQGSTILSTSYRSLLWHLYGVLIILQYILQIKRPEADTFISVGCGGCTSRNSWLFFTFNYYAYPDVFMIPSFVYGALVLYWDRIGFKRLNWFHAAVYLLIFIAYSFSELMFRQTATQWLANVATCIVVYVSYQIIFHYLLVHAPWLFNDVDESQPPEDVYAEMEQMNDVRLDPDEEDDTVVSFTPLGDMQSRVLATPSRAARFI